MLYFTGRLSRPRRVAKYAWVDSAPFSEGLYFFGWREPKRAPSSSELIFFRPLRDVAVFP